MIHRDGLRDRTETAETAETAPQGWNPFVPRKPQRAAAGEGPIAMLPVVTPRTLLPRHATAAEPGGRDEQRRITRAWNGLQLPL